MNPDSATGCWVKTGSFGPISTSIWSAATGDVPLITEPLTPEDYEQERVPSEQIYEQIIDDLEFAAENLPLKSEYASDDLGRATRGAAESMLARVYLYLEDYPNAESYARDVINSGEYELLSDYFTIYG